MKKLSFFALAAFALASCVEPTNIGRFLEDEAVQGIINREHCECDCEQQEEAVEPEESKEN